jgi:hypothetical protein
MYGLEVGNLKGAVTVRVKGEPANGLDRGQRGGTEGTGRGGARRGSEFYRPGAGASSGCGDSQAGGFFDNKRSYYEVIAGRQAYDYLICVSTGKVIEFSSEKLRKLRDEICAEHGFDPSRISFMSLGSRRGEGAGK